MGGQTAVGYENPDGSVDYALYMGGMHTPWDFDRYCGISERIKTSRKAASIEDYFDDTRNADEDCSMRMLVRLDGTGVCRLWGHHVELVWRAVPVSK